jgi:hypothetical protein
MTDSAGSRRRRGRWTGHEGDRHRCSSRRVSLRLTLLRQAHRDAGGAVMRAGRARQSSHFEPSLQAAARLSPHRLGERPPLFRGPLASARGGTWSVPQERGAQHGRNRCENGGRKESDVVAAG